ncbi:hypothetical protein BGW36DRAFT_288829 [Talaromyces proteolyticus]|uniref:Fumarylacetoacetase-like C-terminal domain-containing protein n=1 Tax=Talaromyces proteolyticus TaxID=1131652 RepID=A0AAD4KXK0_9EURO|nr:uncharacterized protein BGW36DRAFT_288829 [Talaromyces proteolyticus]KAH8703391.1 hypothetical protein BGW36DRAFT_288829 [Talaromyces proteolyticus]
MTSKCDGWSYLIRFINGNDNRTYFGDAILPAGASGLEDTAEPLSLEARIITGNPLSTEYEISNERVPVKKLLGPLVREIVPDIRCIGGNYKSHLKELGVKPPKYPTMFPKLNNALADHGDVTEIPRIAQDQQADYEGELVVVIGKDAKNVSEADALDYVLGYSIANDVSARKWQMDPDLVGTSPPPQMSFSKSFDGFCPVGPCVVSSKIIRDGLDLALSTKVNGELRQKGTTSDLLFNVAQIIAFCSQGSSLFAGSILLTGTPSGVGMAMKPPRFLQDGDVVEISIEKIGTLRHSIKYV